MNKLTSDRLQNLTAHATLAPLVGKTVAVLGFGAQGAAHAQNLRDSGLHVVVAQRPGSDRHAAAIAAGFPPLSISAAVQQSDVLISGLPDDAYPRIFAAEIEPHLRPGQTLGFMHGFVMHYGLVRPRPEVDVVMVAPKAQGRGVRDAFTAGQGVVALLALAQDASGNARDTALAWAAGIGADRAAILLTTFKDETETDLFGEQAVLCGGLTALILAAYETLTAAGYPPELAYSECCHEVKLIADLIHAGGIDYMRRRVSSTARYGDVSRGPRVIDNHVHQTLRTILSEVQSGQFAREFLHRSAALPADARLTEFEAVGKQFRALANPDARGR